METEMLELWDLGPQNTGFLSFAFQVLHNVGI